jgi:hypothetical protein
MSFIRTVTYTNGIHLLIWCSVLDHVNVSACDLLSVSFLCVDQSLDQCYILVEIKWCLTRLLKKYYIQPTGKEPYKLNIHEQFIIAPNEVCVKLEKRPQ